MDPMGKIESHRMGNMIVEQCKDGWWFHPIPPKKRLGWIIIPDMRENEIDNDAYNDTTMIMIRAIFVGK